MRRASAEVIVPLSFVVWFVAIAFGVIHWGVWAGIAAWLAPPAVVGAFVLLGAVRQINRQPLEDSIARHPSSHEWDEPDSGNVVDIRRDGLGKR